MEENEKTTDQLAREYAGINHNNPIDAKARRIIYSDYQKYDDFIAGFEKCQSLNENGFVAGFERCKQLKEKKEELFDEVLDALILAHFHILGIECTENGRTIHRKEIVEKIYATIQKAQD